MTQKILAETEKARVIFVMVPNGSINFKMFLNGVFRYRYSGRDRYLQIPAYNKWQFLCLLNEATEERAAVIVDEGELTMSEDEYRFFNYTQNRYNLYDQSDSLQSLAQSVGVDTNKNWAVCFELKK